jgi:hypothetical protein
MKRTFALLTGAAAPDRPALRRYNNLGHRDGSATCLTMLAAGPVARRRRCPR